MKIGIDISQTAYEGTGVGNFVTCLVRSLIHSDHENEYILFFSSMRRKFQISNFMAKSDLISAQQLDLPKNVIVKEYKFPPTLLDLLWNKMHVLPIEQLIGDVDIFVSSDWTQPPLRKAKGVSILYDLIVYKHPEETAEKIIATQKRRLQWMKKECQKIICISEATKKDAKDILGIEEERLAVIYPGIL